MVVGRLVLGIAGLTEEPDDVAHAFADGVRVRRSFGEVPRDGLGLPEVGARGPRDRSLGGRGEVLVEPPESFVGHVRG